MASAQSAAVEEVTLEPAHVPAVRTFRKIVREVGKRPFQFPAYGDTVCVSYEAFLKESYIVFDSTARSGRDFYFDVGMHQVSRGLDDGVASMAVGEACELQIPAEFAFGDRGFANLVPRAAHVVYRIQLKSIKRGRRLMCSIL